MARLLVRCMEHAGHRVTVVSNLRAYLNDPEDNAGWQSLQAKAHAERARIAEVWDDGSAPDLWFCYHPYYKSPDLLGPALCAHFGVPYMTCESSYSARRNSGIWADMQAIARDGVRIAALNLCLTTRDLQGLQQACPDATFVRFPPFIATEAFGATPTPEPGHLVCVAMMRAGDKFASYQRLARAVRRMPADVAWHLTVAGDGPMQAEVHALFGDVPQGRMTWAGQLDSGGVAALLARGSVFVWPGCGEAYGLAYLEAQAAGLPVVAMAVAGVPEVVVNGVTGLLTVEDDVAYAAAIERLLRDTALARTMGRAARDRVRDHHSLDAAADRLNRVLQDVVGQHG